MNLIQTTNELVRFFPEKELGKLFDLMVFEIKCFNCNDFSIFGNFIFNFKWPKMQLCERGSISAFLRIRYLAFRLDRGRCNSDQSLR